jgi:hypothetical protein
MQFVHTAIFALFTRFPTIKFDPFFSAHHHEDEDEEDEEEWEVMNFTDRDWFGYDLL